MEEKVIKMSEEKEIEFNTANLATYAYKVKIVPTQKCLGVEVSYSGNNVEEVQKGAVGLWTAVKIDLEAMGFAVSPIEDTKKSKD